MEKEGFVYIWFDRKHKRYYIGCHWGTLDDRYICSSSWMRNSYNRRKTDFKRRIIQRNIPREHLLESEHKWLQLIPDEELGVRYYNLSKKHFGHWSIDKRTHISVREKLSEASKKLHQDPEYKQKYIEGRKKMPPQTQEQIAKRAKSNTGKKRTEETKRKISEANKGQVRGPLAEETKRKLSEALSGSKNPFFGKKHDPELRKRMGERISQAMKGRMPANIPTGYWWTNGFINRRSIDCPGNDWIRGKTTTKKAM